MTDLSYKNKGFIKSLLIKEPDTNLRIIYKLVKSLNTKEISNESIKQYVSKIRVLQKGGDINNTTFAEINENPTLYLYKLFKKYNDSTFNGDLTNNQKININNNIDPKAMSIKNLVEYVAKKKKFKS